MPRLDLGEYSIPMDFESIEIGDVVKSQEFSWIVGCVTKVGTFGKVPGVMIARPSGISDVLLTGDIVPLGYAGAPTL